MAGEMDIDDSAKPTTLEEGEEEQKGKALVVVLVGAPGSGKSTFCDNVMNASSRPWVRICQDVINNGKSGSKAQCLSSAAVALKDKKSVFIDRCNLDKEQRAEFVKLGNPEVDVHAVVLDLPAQLCISRSVKRSGHEGKLQGGRAAAVVNKMLQKKELPKLSEGFSRITFCHSESDVQEAVTLYSGFGPLDTLPSGCFGEKKKADAKVQLGIMQFLKKVDPPAKSGSCSSGTQSSLSGPVMKETQMCNEQTKHKSSGGGKIDGRREGDDMEVESAADTVALANSSDIATNCLDAPPTLAFPSISTADFQFDLEKASDIIVDKVQEYLNKLGHSRLVLVDLSHKSKILSLVKSKAAQRNIDSTRFFTFVGDITCLYSKGGLRCTAIANAANWRLRPGGGGVNAAIFNAAGLSLETATKEQAKSLAPGKAVVVPLPSVSPLFSREGVTHVIHVLGPNMNPQRPNCLKDNYAEGCKILQEAYSSLFEGFASILKTQSTATKGNVGKIDIKESKLSNHSQGQEGEHNVSNQKMKREAVHDEERSKKYKGVKTEAGSHNNGREDQGKSKGKSGASKAWGSWAQALYKMAMDPEKHKNDVLEITPDVVVLNDIYPKAKKHVLVLARLDGVDRLEDVRLEHLQLLKTMHEVGMKWAEKFLQEDDSLIFRLGFHSVPSMRQLHLHVISQDFDSQQLKHKKHWNSFNTEFFRDSVDVIEEVESSGKASIKDESLLSKELRCHRCRSAHPNIPRLKSHIATCQAPFPACLLERNRLIQAPAKPSDR